MAPCGRPVRWKPCIGSVWPTKTLAYREADFLHVLQPLNLREGEREIQMQVAGEGTRPAPVGATESTPGFLSAAWPLLPTATVSLQTPGAAMEASHVVHVHSAGDDWHLGEGF